MGVVATNVAAQIAASKSLRMRRERKIAIRRTKEKPLAHPFQMSQRRCASFSIGCAHPAAYRSSERTFCWLWLAWAIIAVEAWARIWALAIAVVSEE